MLLNKLGLIFIIFTTLFNNVFTQQTKHGCENASDEETKIVCKNMVEAMKNASEYQDNNPLFKPGFQPDSAPDRPELKCLTLNCYCSYLGGISNGSINDCTLPNGQKLKKAIRKELRMLTDEERNEIFAAIREMKDSNDYDYIAAIHRLAYESGGAHGGAAFCVWHLEYIKRFEILLRKRNPSAALPYWDSTLECRLPTPKDSILFTDDFFGTTDSNGYVTTGPFSPWQTLEGNKYITRNVGKGGGCMSEENIQWTLSQTKIENVMAYTLDKKECPYDTQWKALEFPHGKVHNFIGGDMEILFPNRGANDFAFFAHHCFVNLIYETWRQTKQTPTQRLNDYPADIAACESTAHFKNATMSQFAVNFIFYFLNLIFKPLKNADGLRNEYTDNLYEYAPRPTCTNSDIECGSKYLFCDLSHDSPHCAAKVKPGGNCKGFNKGEQVCMNSTCINDICIVQSKTTIKSEKTFTSTSKITLGRKNITKQNEVTTSTIPTTILSTIKTTKEKTPITTLPNIVTTTITPKTSVKFLASTHKISINTTTFIKTITSITTRKTQETTNELITTKMAEETTDFPEKSTTEIPEETTQNFPEETTQNFPEETTQNLPETTSALPTKPTENLTTKAKTFTTTQKQTTTTTNHSKTKKAKKHHKKHSKHHKTFMITFVNSTINPFFTTKQPTTKMFTTVKPVKKGKKCKCNKKHSPKKLPNEKTNDRSSAITIPDHIVLRFPNFVNPTGKPPKN